MAPPAEALWKGSAHLRALCVHSGHTHTVMRCSCLCCKTWGGQEGCGHTAEEHQARQHGCTSARLTVVHT